MALPTSGQAITPSVRLVREIGGGGMGRVWLAQHTTLHTTVVVKFLSPELADSPEAIERFSREASAAAQVKSPHVVQMFDHGVTADGVPYIVMEHLDGRDLRGVLNATTRLTVHDMQPIVVQLAKALSRAHRTGVVHRDIKPENIFLCDHGDDILVKLLDFGIAKAAIHTGTATGTVIGTPPYMSPEQLVGKKLDLRTDLWSLGVVIYEALTGDLPFQGANLGAVTLAVFHGRVRRPSEVYPPLGASFDGFFGRALAREVEDRFASASELADAFIVAAGGRVSHVPPLRADVSQPIGAVSASTVSSELPTVRAEPPARRPHLVVAALAAVFVAVGLVVVVARTREQPSHVEPVTASTPVISASASAPTVEPLPPPVVSVAPSVSAAPKPKSTKGVTLPPKKVGKHDAPIY